MNLFLQKILPQFLVTWLIGKLAHCRNKAFKNWFIKFFIRQFGVDMQLAVEPDYRAYETFSDFFIRKIKLDQRPVCSGKLDIASPVDGTTSEFGQIKDNRLLQAKGIDYRLVELIGGDQRLAEKFVDGNYATFYLSPKDYHRVHMPYAGTLRSMTHIPGKLFSVSTEVTRQIPKVYAGNERVVFRFDSEIGPFLMVMVGAIGVGSVATTWAGTVTNHAETDISSIDYPASGSKAMTFAKGDELGYFDMGSTVVMVFPAVALQWHELQLEKPVVMGEKVGGFIA